MGSINWQWLIQTGQVKEYALSPTPGLTDAQMVKQKNTHPPVSCVTQTVTQSAIGWGKKGKGHKDGFMFLFLKNEIPMVGEFLTQAVRDEALKGLQAMEFKNCDESRRPELRDANNFNRSQGNPNPVPAGELNFGFGNQGRLLYKFNPANQAKMKRRKAVATANQYGPFEHLLPLLVAMDGLFARALPFKFQLQNRRIPAVFRQAGITAFSTVTLLRSAPSALHVDEGNGNTLTCLTSVAPGEYSGGRFCFVQYGVEIPVKPGDLLIATTPRDWHCNLTPVVGEKYSVIGYFRLPLVGLLPEYLEREAAKEAKRAMKKGDQAGSR